jgi:Bacterial Ig domain
MSAPVGAPVASISTQSPSIASATAAPIDPSLTTAAPVATLPTAIAAPFANPVPTALSEQNATAAPTSVGDPVPSPRNMTNVVTVETTSNTPVEIPLPYQVDNETTVAVRVEPNFGTVLIPINGSVIYKPFEGFKGEDSFIVQVCDSELTCKVVTLRVTVQPESSHDSSFNPLYCLALLGVLPLGAIALVLRKSRGRGAQQSSPKTAEPLPGTPSTTMDPTTQANIPSLKHDNDDTLAEEQLDALPEEASDDSDCYTSGLTIDEGSFIEAHVVASRVSTSTKATHRPNEQAHLPQHKDQCRSVPLGDRHAIVQPIANAILIRDDDDSPAIVPPSNRTEA